MSGSGNKRARNDVDDEDDDDDDTNNQQQYSNFRNEDGYDDDEDYCYRPQTQSTSCLSPSLSQLTPMPLSSSTTAGSQLNPSSSGNI